MNHSTTLYHELCRKLFLGGLSWETDERDLMDYFNKYGQVDKVTIKYDNVTGRSRGFGFVTFVNMDSVDAVLNAGPHYIKNRAVDPKRPKGKTGLKKIFVGGINGDLSKEEIKSYFEKFGNIENIERPFDRQRNRSRDFCFIIFETEEAAESAISNPKQVIGGKECDIKLAHPQRNQGGGMGGGHMGGGGGFGGPRGGRGPSGGGNGGGNTFFKNSNRSGGGGGGGNGNGGGNNVGNNWRNSDGRPAGGFRTGGHDDGRGFSETQFLTNMDTMPNNGYGYKNSGYNNNFFPNYWN
ncbi:PREDICTED: RNA-binding protein squid-like [Rhagoletis zephyria]|uniref:RNA-binding protein squid-like n=1 Tax=Rhagoletis zephyria TaxID=28612 RepID=UPI0008112282|nr:PREDICTED: RNA-binding protein squid-like [Rhagoletis zephyria]KAH9387947.1 hypothetical protein TYRP_009147 [Tyrophagus putrescentiae]